MTASPQELTIACAALPTYPESKTWFRAVQPRFWQTALQTGHTNSYASRFNAGINAAQPFELLYLAENAAVALFEVRALFGTLTKPGGVISNVNSSWIVLNVSVSLSHIADLTTVSAQDTLSTTAQELTGDWEGYQQRSYGTTVAEPTGAAPTQALGAALYSVPGLEGFRTLSARIPYHEALIVFPQKLGPGSYVQFFDPATGQTLSIP